MADTKKDVDLLEQRIEEAMGNRGWGWGADQGPSRADARLVGSRGVTQGVHVF